MPKRWKLKPKPSEGLRQQFESLHPLLLQLLYNRNLLEEKSHQDFLDPKYERLLSPFLFKDMEKATERIWQAIHHDEKICIYGDYDADAVTANAILRQTFRYLGYQNIGSYIPDRFTEGYGVNLEALAKIKEQGATLIITVDCGTNSVQAAKWCQENGVDLIITDHHEIIGEIPDVLALINPKNPKDEYPDKNITGVGVAFKMACAILSRGDKVAPRLAGACSGQPATYVAGWEKWLLDLVAIGTVADCHSLTGENRILVKYGLKVLAKTKWPGLRALYKTAGLDFKKKLPDTYILGFIIAPRLNAAGRLEHAGRALDLLLEEDFEKALGKAQQLEEINHRRQDLTARVLSEAREKVLGISERKILVLLGENWPQGVVGLVAGKLAEEFNKPVIVLSKEEESSVGSARSVGDYNIVEALKHASDHLSVFGGHAQAAGLTLKTKEFENFYKKLLEHADEHIKEKNLKSVLELEAELNEADLSFEVYSLLAVLEPFGVGNPRPKFLLKEAQIESLRRVGNGGDHVQMNLRVGSRFCPAIWFRAGERAGQFKLNSSISAVCELMEDSWNGNKKLKLRIVDVKKMLE